MDRTLSVDNQQHVLPIEICFLKSKFPFIVYTLFFFIQNGATAFDIAKLYGHHQVSEDLKQHSASQKIQTKIAQVSDS